MSNLETLLWISCGFVSLVIAFFGVTTYRWLLKKEAGCNKG